MAILIENLNTTFAQTIGVESGATIAVLCQDPMGWPAGNIGGIWDYDIYTVINGSLGTQITGYTLTFTGDGWTRVRISYEGGSKTLNLNMASGYNLFSIDNYITLETQTIQYPLILQWGKTQISSGNLAKTSTTTWQTTYPISCQVMSDIISTGIIKTNDFNGGGPEVSYKTSTNVMHTGVIYNRNSGTAITGPVYWHWMAVGA